MSSTYYSAAWTDSGFLLGCSHEHKTVSDAASCIPCAGGYVVGVENIVIRALTRAEESELQCAISSQSTDNPNADMIDSVLNRLSEWETMELERMYSEDRHALPEAFGSLSHTVRKPKSGRY
jgi:hypothetical protein